VKRSLLLTASSFAGLAALAAFGACTDPGAPAHGGNDILTRTNPIAPGAVCPAGGTAVETGRDQNGNGVLDDAEVEQTSTVCAPDTPPTLTRVDEERPGANCPAGGRAVKHGPDRNHNGVLDDDEVAGVVYACKADDLFEGDFRAEMWQDAAQVARLGRARVVTGTLIIATDQPVSLPALALVGGGFGIAPGSAPGSLDLPALAEVGGGLALDRGLSGPLALPALAQVGRDLRVAVADVDGVSFPALTQVGGSFAVISAAAPSIDVPHLSSVGGDIVLAQLPELTAIALPAIATVGGDVEIRQVPKLAAADGLARLTAVDTLTIDAAPALHDLPLPLLSNAWRVVVTDTGITRVFVPNVTSLGELALGGNPALTAVTMPRLTTVGRIGITYAPALTDLGLSALVTIQGSADGFSGLTLTYTGLTSVELAVARSTGPIAFLSNPDLTSIRLPKLTVAPAVNVSKNPLLDTLAMPALTEIPSLFISAKLSSLVLSPQLTVTKQLAIGSTRFVSLPAIHLAPGASLSVSSNPNLTDMHGLVLPGELTNVAIQDNAALTSLAGLEPITRLTGTLLVKSNPALAHLAGVDGITSAGVIDIEDEAALTSLAGLDHVTKVDNYVMVNDDPALTSLAGLGAVKTIGGSLVVMRDHALASIAALAQLESVGLAQGPVNGGPILFGDDPALPATDVAALIARVHQP
jgi:hypothetical protein